MKNHVYVIRDYDGVCGGECLISFSYVPSKGELKKHAKKYKKKFHINGDTTLHRLIDENHYEATAIIKV
ncbi:hypothetical protein [Caulobacter phage Cr30]|uniref:hypothetical protein n=1 Tax=Caulobacter phage Cr30 TaxID=1357714 RepID=UPI0004A9BAD2|nr:hypothetical protein OZ74_gp268 [Caulobacter phage Cr30]AGS81075.1 hypothetical protein [Caulobacter phage Cr30]